MSNPRDLKAVQQSLTYLERGNLTRQEVVDRIGNALSGDEIDGVLEVVAPEHHPLIHAGYREALQRRADEDCLQPERSPFDPISYEYHGRVAELLLTPAPGEPPWSQFAAVCLPSFQPEWSLRLIRPRKGSPDIREPTLLVVRANAAIWGPTTSTVETTRYTRPIQDALATRLEAVWRMMLESTRASRHVGMGVDGVTYHFEYRQHSGRAWSPRAGTRAARFVEVTHTLAQYTVAEDSKRAELEVELENQLRGFEV